jgi:hypothetical protein
VPTLLIADERGEIKTRNMCLPTKPCADYPLQPLLPRKSSSQTFADASRVVPDSRFRTALGGEDVYTKAHV